MKIIQFTIFCIAVSCASNAVSADMLKVPQHIWDGLQPQQRALLSEKFVVNVRSGKAYGVIIDAQSLNESTNGSNAGSQLGAALGSATYVDNAFRGAPRNWNYSATGNLTAQLAGAMIGSLANQPTQARFRTRYTIKNGAGGVEYVEEIKSDAFRHTMGLCVSIGPIQPIDSDTCSMTREQFLAKYSWLEKTGQQIVSIPETPINAIQTIAMALPQQEQLQPVTAIEKIYCRFGAASPVRVSQSVCESAGGSVIP